MSATYRAIHAIALGSGAEPWRVGLGERSVVGTLAGRSIDGQDTLAFSVLQGIRAMVETFPLAKAQKAYRRMMNNEARFRV